MRRALLTLLLMVAAHASGGSSVVLMPLDNVSGEQSATSVLPPLIAKAMEAKGWKVAGGDIEPLLETERVRYFDSLDANVRHDILEKSGADAILTVTVYTYAQGRNPTVGLSAHLIDAEGRITWSNVAAVASSDTERAFGLGRKETINEVAAEAVGRLMEKCTPGSPTRPAGRRTRPTSPHYVSDDLDKSRPICVLPFDNNSNAPDAPRVLADVLALRLAAAGFSVVDPAVLRAAALKARISLRSVNSNDLATLAKSVGTPLFLRGTVYAFDDPTARNSAIPPALDVEATLVDVSTAKVLWAAQQNRKGTDYIGFLMLGAVSNSVSLTDRVATEMIATARTNHANKNASGDRAAVASLGRKGRQQQLHAGQSQR